MINSPQIATNFRQLVPEILWLEPEYFDRARSIASKLSGEDRQWQAYLDVLALLSLENWFGERLKTERLNHERSSIFHPQYGRLIEGVCCLQLGELQFYTIAVESPIDDLVAIPRAALELPEFAAHFYMLIEVLEEEEEAIFRGALRRDRFDQYRQSMELSPTPDWHYPIPLAWFDGEPNHLLFDCRYLDPQDISLPAPIPTPALSAADLRRLLLALPSPPVELWRHLTWEQGSIVLRYPELLEVDIATVPPEALRSLDALLEYLHRPPRVRHSVRLSQWLRRSFEKSWQQIEAVLTPPELGIVRELGAEPDTDEPTATPETIASMIHLLQPERPEATRCQAAGVLGEIGAGHPDATAALAELLQTAREEETRWQAALSLGKIEPDHPAAGVKRARAIDLGIQLNGYQVALVVAIVPKADGKLGVWLEVKPMGQLAVLPPQLTLGILSESGEVRMEVETRSDERGEGKDTALGQRFNVRPGKRFSVRVSLGEVSLTEDFLA